MDVIRLGVLTRFAIIVLLLTVGDTNRLLLYVTGVLIINLLFAYQLISGDDPVIAP